AGGIGENLVYYWGPKDIRDAGDKAVGATIRLGGLVKEGTIDYRPDSTDLAFDVIDDEATVHVRSHGVPPQMFRENIGVVIEGTMTRGGYFESSRLMVSHDNEYRSPDDLKNIDIKEFIQSAEGAKPSGKGGS
ncbi:MAG TPA: cytochrome c maturation protein CcmE, partial [Thermoanaerobaculia bacterium]|nr:cytochrome c maturation protein CcmE [Thermoanaerobaculia bacterium]